MRDEKRDTVRPDVGKPHGGQLHARKMKFPAAEEYTSVRSSVPYTPKPDFSSCNKEPKRMKGTLLAVAAVAIAIGAGSFFILHSSKAPPTPRSSGPMVSDVQAQNIFFVSNRDLDTEATESAKAALKEGRVPPLLKDAPEKTRQEIISGKQSLYTVHIVDFSHIGDSVDILLDNLYFSTLVEERVNTPGVPSTADSKSSDGQGGFGEPVKFSSNRGIKLTIPLEKGATKKIEFRTAVDAGGAGVAFRAVSSQAEIHSRVMAVGESEGWTISFK